MKISEKIPTVTVLMSVYNGDAYLKESIDSILAQTYKDFEFVIYDDCSCDRTKEIIQSYNDPRIVYRQNKINKGLTTNLSEGVSLSQAKYIVRMDADDIAYHDRLEKQVKWMENHANISIMGSPVSYFRENPGDGGISKQPIDDATIKAKLFISFTLLHPTIIIRKSDLDDNKLNYNPAYRYSQDHALYLDCILAGLKFSNYPEPLLFMRSHSASISQFKHKEQVECTKRARSKFLALSGLDKECSREEINAYNKIASGYFPCSIIEIENYVSFVEKLTNNHNVGSIFDIKILKRLMSEELLNGAYQAVNRKELKAAAIKAYSSKLNRYCEKWSMKQKVKFFIKWMVKK